MPQTSIRLDRWLALLAFGSRSEVRELIRDGRISVNSLPVRDASAVCSPERDILAIDGCETDGRLQRHIMLNKPAGVLTAARDPAQTTVMDLLPPVFRSLGCMPVGRLDKDTTGLLLLTCDGEMAHRLLSPSRGIVKVYRAEVTGIPDARDITAFERGLELSDFTALPSKLSVIAASRSSSLVEITVTEGRFHQVKRMLDAVGHTALSLDRISFGPLRLDKSLAQGAWRELAPEELTALRRAVGLETAQEQTPQNETGILRQDPPLCEQP